MNTKKKLSNIGTFVLPLLLSVLSSCQSSEQKAHDHSDCHQDTGELVQAVSPGKQVLSRQATVIPRPANLGGTFRAEGFITMAQDRNRSVAARFGGRIEKLYFKYNNQRVRQGDKIMDIYSPALRTIQEEHLFLIKSGADNSLIEKSREKLLLLGITDDQIRQLEKSGTAALTISVFSPASGYIFFNIPATQQDAVPENEMAAGSMSMEQNTKTENVSRAATSQIREGMYVNNGQALFSVNDLLEVWALVSMPIDRSAQIPGNRAVQLFHESNPLKPLTGKLVLIERTFEEADQRFARVRVALTNTNNNLKINSLVTAEFPLGDETGGAQVPASAVYKTGLNSYVWVKTAANPNGADIFRVRKVITGASHNGYTVIKSGISANEEIALHAGLMIDSETFLNGN